MKYLITSIFLILICGGVLVSCVEEEPEVVDPCKTTPNCIPDLSDWKLHYKPHNADCTMCHTTCTPNIAHSFSTVGQIWTVEDSYCLKCHKKQHLTSN
jgi:hypothetical protein